MGEKATVRLICIIAGAILAAFLVPLAVRARSSPPRPVEAPVRSAQWNNWAQISYNPNDEGMQFSPALAAHQNSTKLYVMWSRQVGAGDEEYDPYRTSSPNEGGSWGTRDLIHSTPTSNTVYVDVALDSSGAPHYVWAENTVTPYSYTLYYSSTHMLSIQEITQYNGLLQPAIAVGSSQVHVVWSQGDQDIMYNSKTFASVSWGSATTIRSSTAVQDPNITVDGSDTAHVVWSEGNEPTNTDIKYKNNNTWPGWSGAPATVYEGSVAGYGMGFRPDIAVGSNIYVVWCAYKEEVPGDPTTQRQYVLFGQSTNGTSWSVTEPPISGGFLYANTNAPKYLRPGIAVDTNEKIHVAFNGSEGGVGETENIFYVSKKQGGSWRPRQNVTDHLGDYNNTTPAIATRGDYVHLLWARQNMPPDPTTRYDVWYTRASIIEQEGGVFLPIILKKSY